MKQGWQTRLGWWIVVTVLVLNLVWLLVTLAKPRLGGSVMVTVPAAPPFDKVGGWGDVWLTVSALPKYYAVAELYQDDTGRHFRDYDGTVYNLKPWLPDTARRAAANIRATGWDMQRPWPDEPSQFERKRTAARKLAEAAYRETLQEAR